jgi:inner membrane protein
MTTETVWQYIPWVWVILALAFMMAEIFTAGFFLFCFGIGAFVAALLGFLEFDFFWQLTTFIVVSGIALALSRPFANRVSNQEPNTVGIDRVLGQRALVIKAINPVTSEGEVRVAHEKWSADSVDGQPIPAGATVEVVEVVGTHLRVQSLLPPTGAPVEQSETFV